MDHPGLRQLVGREVSSIEFVRDYVQLRFDGPCLSAYTLPVVQTPDRVLSPSSEGYAEALIGFIGKRMETAESREGERIQCRFSDGVSFAISLRSEDYRAAEAAMLTTEEKEIWTW